MFPPSPNKYEPYNFNVFLLICYMGNNCWRVMRNCTQETEPDENNSREC